MNQTDSNKETMEKGLMNSSDSFQKGVLPDDTTVSLKGSAFKSMRTELEEAKLLREQFERQKEELERLRQENGIFSDTKKDIIAKEKKLIQDAGERMDKLSERFGENEEAQKMKNAISFVKSQILGLLGKDDILLTPEFQNNEKKFTTAILAASLDGDYREELAKKEVEEAEKRASELQAQLEEMKQKVLEMDARLSFLNRGASSTYQSGVHSATGAPSSVMVGASMDVPRSNEPMFSRFGINASADSLKKTSENTPETKPPSTSMSYGLFSKPSAPSSYSSSANNSNMNNSNTTRSVSSPAANTPTKTPEVPKQNIIPKTFKNPIDALRAYGNFDDRFAQAKMDYKTKGVTMIAATASLDGAAYDLNSHKEEIRNCTDILPDNINDWRTVLGGQITNPILY